MSTPEFDHQAFAREVPDMVDTAEGYAELGVTTEAAIEWASWLFTPADCTLWSSQGFSAEDAAGYADRGLTPTQAKTERAARPVFTPGQLVTVMRSDGRIEADWHLMTDLSKGDGFTAPELIGCHVWKFTEGTLKDHLAGRETKARAKLVSLLDLIQWAPLTPTE